MTTFIIKINRVEYSYGFELKDEAKTYTKYVTVSKITNDCATECGLKVGDKVVSINGESVVGKNYIMLKKNIRQSLGNCVVLEILKEFDYQMTSPNLSLPYMNLPHLELSFGRSLIPRGSIRDKIKLFQDTPKNDVIKSFNRSNSLDSLNRFSLQRKNDEDSVTKKIPKMSSTSIETLNKYIDSDISTSKNNLNELKSQKYCICASPFLSLDITYDNFNDTISQEPFIDDNLYLANDNVRIQLPENSIRVIESSYPEPIKRPGSLTLFENQNIKKDLISNLEIPKIPKNFIIPFIFAQLSPGFMNTKSRSSQNLFEESKNDWSGTSSNAINCVECESMTDISCIENENYFGKKKFLRQQSIITNIPIKLRILQFHDGLKSKGWKDYIMEPDTNGARFRKRTTENQKADKTNDFIIRLDNISKFEMEIPNKHHKSSTETDFSVHEALSIFSLVAFNGSIHLKFHFNPSMYQDSQSSIRAHQTFNKIITSLKSAKNKIPQSINLHSLSQCSSTNGSINGTQSNTTPVKELNSSIEEFNNASHHNSGSNSYKSMSKSSAENLPNTTSEIIVQSQSKNILKQAFDKIKPERKIKIIPANQAFTGTKADFAETQKQLECGHSPQELYSSEETSIHFNRYIHEVPRMSNPPTIPMIIYLCTEIVEKIGLNVEGIYRISGNQRIIRTLSNTLNKKLDGIDASLPEWNNVHAVCGILKLFLRKLKQHLIPADLSHVLAYSCKGVEVDNPRSLSKVLMDIRYHLSSYKIPSQQRSNSNDVDQIECRWHSLQHVLKHLSKVVSNRQYNNMDEHSISVCFNPVIMESWPNNINDFKTDNEITVKALELILIHQDWLFNNWHSELDCSWGSELVDKAFYYAREFIDKKYSENFTLSYLEEYEDEDVNDSQIDINKMVEEIIRRSTTTFKEKPKLERRHSSHIPGEYPVVSRKEEDTPKNSNLRCSSQISDALDLFSHANWIIEFAKVPKVIENKEKVLKRQTPVDKHSVELISKRFSNNSQT